MLCFVKRFKGHEDILSLEKKKNSVVGWIIAVSVKWSSNHLKVVAFLLRFLFSIFRQMTCKHIVDIYLWRTKIKRIAHWI